MKKVVLAALAAVLGLAGYQWYAIFGRPDGKLKLRGTALAAQAAPPAGEATREIEAEAPPAPTISVQLSAETIEAFPATVVVREGGREHVAHYTGQARRIKPIFVLPIQVYDIASYVVEPKPGAPNDLLDGLLVDGPPKVYLLRFLNNIPGKKIMDDIYDEINTTFTDVDVDRLQENIDRFVKQFQGGSKKGDVVAIVWLPGGKVYSGFNTPEAVQFIGHDVPFARAIWRIWAGDKFGDKRVQLVSRYASPAVK
jgi:hypothetical protein